MVLIMAAIIKVQFIEWLKENYCILTFLFGWKHLLCFFVFSGCEQRDFCCAKQTLDVQNILPLCRRSVIKITDYSTPQVQACSLLNNTPCWKEGDIFPSKVKCYI